MKTVTTEMKKARAAKRNRELMNKSVQEKLMQGFKYESMQDVTTDQIAQLLADLYKEDVLNAIDGEPYDVELKTEADKIRFLRDTFEKEYLHHNNRNGLKYRLFTDWFQGLPSVCQMKFYNFEMIEDAKEKGITATEETEYLLVESIWKAYGLAASRLTNLI